MRLCERRNAPSYMPTRVCPVVTSEARSAPAVPATSCRRLTSGGRLTTPTRMPAASRTREVTNPSAAGSLCRLATGNTTTAVPRPGGCDAGQGPDELGEGTAQHARVAAGTEDEPDTVVHRAVQRERRDR